MILIINSSPRKESTDYVVAEADKILREHAYNTKFVKLREKDIDFCKHCDYCLENGECIQKDDMKKINSLLDEAKGIVLATPVYSSGINAQLKAMMDRTRSLMARDENALKGKIGTGIAIGGDRMGGQEIALSQIHNFFILNGVIPVSGGPFGANLGSTYWSKDNKEGVKKDDEGAKTLKKTINRFMEFLDMYV